MKRAWLLWWIATTGLAAYTLAGFVASYTNIVDIKLKPGVRVAVTTLRLTDDRLRMELVFRGDHTRRPELGDYAHGEWVPSRLIEFLLPGSAIRISASSPGAEPVVYEAMPKGGWGIDTVFRELTSNLSIRRGVWRRPDPAGTPHVDLRRGFTAFTLEVVSVEPPLVAESVQLLVHPALGVKQCMPNVCWLWGWFFWPLGVLLLMLWVGVIFLAGWRNARRQNPGRQQLSSGGAQ